MVVAHRTPRSFLHVVLLLFIFVFVLCIILVEIVLYALLRGFVTTVERVFRSRLRSICHDGMNRATTYAEWERYAIELDTLSGLDEWKEYGDGELDKVFVEQHTRELHDRRVSGDVAGLRKTLTTVCHKNIAGILNERLYSRTHDGTMHCIDLFVDEIVLSINFIRDHGSSHIQCNGGEKDDIIDFFEKLEIQYGKTALALSGGAGNGYFHIGVCRTLLEMELLPTIISGSSAGSLVGALVCCYTDDELKTILVPEIYTKLNACQGSMWSKIQHFMKNRCIFSRKSWLEKTRNLLGDFSFKEAYERTGRMLNIVVTASDRHSPTKMLNYITAPVSHDVLVYSAVVSSSSMPFFMSKSGLLMKDKNGQPHRAHLEREVLYTDGGLQCDLPMTQLAYFFHVNNFFVSQVSPQNIPFFFSSGAGEPVSQVWKSDYRGGLIINMIEQGLKLNMQMWLRLLADFDLYPTGSDLSEIFLQTTLGHVTLNPPVRLSDYWNIVQDPTIERMRSYIRRAELYTWPKLSFCKMSFKIEKSIEHALVVLGTKPRLHDGSSIVDYYNSRSCAVPSPMCVNIIRDESAELID